MQEAGVDPGVVALVAAGLFREDDQVAAVLQVTDALAHGEHHPLVVVDRDARGAAQHRRHDGGSQVGQGDIKQRLGPATGLPPVVLADVGRNQLGIHHVMIQPGIAVLGERKMSAHINGAESTGMIADEHAGLVDKGLCPGGFEFRGDVPVKADQRFIQLAHGCAPLIQNRTRYSIIKERLRQIWRV